MSKLHSSAALIQYYARKWLKNLSTKQNEDLGIKVYEQQTLSGPSSNKLTIEAKQTSIQVSVSNVESPDGNTSQSLRKTMIPLLDFKKLDQKKENPYTDKDMTGGRKTSSALEVKDGQEPNTTTSRSIFERNTFQELLNKQGVTHIEEFKPNNYPEMLKMREEAIKFRERAEQIYFKKMYNQKQFSPRTY